MAMKFRAVKTAIVALLGAAATGRFRVIGYQDQAKAADEVKDSNRSVQVFYSRGTFPRSAAGIQGPVQHDMVFRVELTVSTAASGDLATLADPTASASAMAAALAGFQLATERADNSIDELADIVFQILMDARNMDFGLLDGDGNPEEVEDRWIPTIEKNEPLPRGELVVLSGSVDVTCGIDEEIVGDTGVEAEDGNAVNIDLDIQDEDHNQDTAKAGVQGGS